MKVKWAAIVVVALAIAVIAYKTRTHRSVASPQEIPRVLLVADLSEADSGDPCADIIRSVQAARARGVHVAELNPNSKSEIMSCYHVMTVSTVLILDDAGQVKSRFEGEDKTTVAAIRDRTWEVEMNFAHSLNQALSGSSLLALPLALLGGLIAGMNPCCLALYPAVAGTCCSGEEVSTVPRPLEMPSPSFLESPSQSLHSAR
jgi:hypothetical protein